MTNLRGFMAELSDIGEAVEREQHLLERREEIADEARRLQKKARSDLRRNLGSFSTGIAGATWSIATGDPIGAVLGTGSLALGLGSETNTVGAYSYLFSIDRKY